MTRTPTAGITTDSSGRITINKEYRRQRIFLRLGHVSQEQAEHRLREELDRLKWEIERRMHAAPVSADCAIRFLVESKY